MWRNDFNLWGIIDEYTKPLFKKYLFKLFDPAVDALNNIPFVDIKFAALIELGNSVLINGWKLWEF